MTALVKTTDTDLIQFSSDQVDLIKRTIAKDATNDELQLFLHQCQKTGLDPLAKQIYFQKYKDNRTGVSRVTIITSIDGFRAIAERTGKYAGSETAHFEMDEQKHPIQATVTVYKMVEGIRCAFSASARWDEYCPGQGKDFMWKRMPTTMLAKVAEALALRKAFPLNLSGTYTSDEMDQAKPSLSPVDIKSTAPQIDNSTGEVKEAEFSEPKKEETDQEKIILAFMEIGMPLSEVEGLVGGPISGVEIGVLRALYASKKRDQFLAENKK